MRAPVSHRLIHLGALAHEVDDRDAECLDRCRTDDIFLLGAELSRLV